MAEFAASIIGIVSAGTKVALVLSQLAADVGSAGHEARMIGGEIRSFCSVLKTLDETIETIEKSPCYAHCSELIKDMTDDSLQMFTEILNAVDKLKKMTAGREGKDGNFGFVERVQWAVFKKPKLLVLRAAIEAYKTNLTLMLTTLSTAERATRRISTRKDAVALAQDRQDRSLLESLELDREATMIELAQAERHYEEAMSPHPAESSTRGVDTAPNNGPPSCDAVVSNIDLGNTGLMSSVRNEIQSIRSSLSRNAETDNEALQARIVRHSKRISSMLEDDQKRLSQRWSQTLREDSKIVSEETSLEPLYIVACQHPLKAPDQDAGSATGSVETDASTAIALNRPHDRNEEFLEFDPRTIALYTSFISWIIQLDAPSQQKVLRTLKQDIDRWAGGLETHRNTATANDAGQSSPSNGRTASSTDTKFDAKAEHVLNLVENQMLAWSKPAISKQECAPQFAISHDVRGATIDLGRQHIINLPEKTLDIIGAKVVKLVLRSNLLVNLPQNLVVCRRLRHLDLSYNSFVTIPDVVKQLPLLEILNMRRNKLCLIPPEVAQMPQLKVLSVAKNNISTLPSFLGHAPNLVILYAEGNPIEYPTRDQIDHAFPTKKDSDSEAKSWTSSLKSTLRRLHQYDTSQAAASSITSETSLLPSPIGSMSGPLLSPRSNVSMSTMSIDRQTDISHTASQRIRKATALPVLQYVRLANTNASFLLDRSQRPPGKKAFALGPTTPTKDVGMLLDVPQSEPLSPASVNTDLSTVSTPRQDALARLTGLNQDSSLSHLASASLPLLSSVDQASTLPKIRVSKHRRSQSEHTLTITKPGVPPTDHNASRRRPVHELPRDKKQTDFERSWDSVYDTSGDDSDDEGSSMWWKSIGNISPQPYRRLEHILSRTKSRRHLAALEPFGSPDILPHRRPLDLSSLDRPDTDDSAHRDALVART
ncbi:hypothetical protein BU25DRAFT_444162 [Macroventuria anomochaeta]|uniref:Uncharacterized protein n=1 Tax=Macroventuria anomochaeta TaxID=301207 RepID=A0ACB6SJ42_9PLEO|nr:uncharacterized protein BU25DRAFT_444162 [Macroventuria anomochaeta]KAF2633404.1 hypothetical protein BU25DRAFT_444162 [Macroventuria anomochaeta]